MENHSDEEGGLENRSRLENLKCDLSHSLGHEDLHKVNMLYI